MNVFKAELSRLRYRRRTVWILVSVLLMSLMAPVLWMDYGRPLDATELRAAQAVFDSLPANECPTCTVLDFVRTTWNFTDIVESGLMPFAAMMAAIVLVAAISYVGSDLHSGAIGTQLTFTPRRWVVVTARAAATGLLGATLMAIAVVSSTVVSAVWFVALNGYEALDATPGLLGLVLSSVLYGAILGIVGALVTVLLGGSTGGGVLLLVVFVADLLILSLDAGVPVPVWLLHLLPTQQGVALLHGSASGADWFGEPLFHIRRSEAIVYHLVVVALLAAVTLPLFERRDIRN